MRLYRKERRLADLRNWFSLECGGKRMFGTQAARKWEARHRFGLNGVSSYKVASARWLSRHYERWLDSGNS
jgi:hypothetical protein